ncbi:unnamed protein product [Peniophora sp. CBMAI 1063]|nr:unnamed protein product [Peniophora sp. CBMAI 1063]
MSDATFVSDHDILVFVPNRGCLEVVSVFDEELLRRDSLAIVARFHLPALRSDFTYADPVMWGRQILGSSGDGIAIATARVRRGLLLDAFDIVVRIPDLLRDAHKRWNTSCGIPEASWRDWGPAYAYMFNHGVIDTIALSISGYRLARSAPLVFGDEDLDGPSCVYVLDFNPKTTARALQEGEHNVYTELSRTRVGFSLLGLTTPPVGEARSCLVTGSYPRHRAGSPFADDIRALGPLRVTMRSYPTRFSTAVLDEDHLIAMASILSLFMASTDRPKSVFQKVDGSQEAVGSIYSL